MEVEDILHMNGVVGQSSYANNSLIQRIIMAKAKQVLEESIRELYEALKPECLMLADMGCGSGPNAFLVVSEIMEVMNKACRNLNRPMLEFGVPKGLVTNEGVTLNKGNIHIAKTSPPEVHKEYHKQFEMDFNVFLRSRACEVVHGGRMVLTFQGRSQINDPNPIFEPLGSALHDMVLEGVIEEEKLDKFNMPCYFPTVEEVKHLVEAEGSFTLNTLETFTVDWSIDETQNLRDRVEFVVKSIRSVMESPFTSAFGEAAMEDLFLRFKDKVEEPLARQTSQYFNLLVSRTRKA